MKNMNIEEARELAELTDRIAANLEKISDDQNNLDMLEEQTMRIVRNLELIVKASPGQ